jgi:hypothetical protein
MGLDDTDGSPTKSWIEALGDKNPFWQMAFGKRPAEELFNLSKDPDCLINLAADPANEAKTSALREKLMTELKKQNDPRVLGQGKVFDHYDSPYNTRKPAKQKDKASAAEKVEINVKKQFGVSQVGIRQAIELAKEHFKKSPDQIVEIIIDAGEYDLLATQSGNGIIDLSGICPGAKGRLVIRGAGQDKTTLYFPKGWNWLYGEEVYRTSFIGIHMTTREMTVSQGHVVSVGSKFVTLDIQSGFPTPEAIWDKSFDHGRYLKQFTNSRTDPRMIESGNEKCAWTDAVHISGSLWQMRLSSKIPPPYKTGDLIAIKSKSTGNTYFFSKGSDFAFIDCKWTQISRGVFRHGFGNITISGCTIQRIPPIEGQTPCLSTPDGGPQIGQLKDPPITGNLVENCNFVATGDDAIAFFNASGVARNNFVTDSFASGINRENSFGIVLEANTVIRCDITNQIGKRE